MPIERSFYNAHNGSAPDINLPHEVGNPYSYPTKSEAESLRGEDGLIINDTKSPGQAKEEGGTMVCLEMAEGEEWVDGFAHEYAVAIESETGIGAWTVGLSAGFHYGESYSVSTSKETIYSGCVQPPPGDPDPDLDFDFGLFTYEATFGNDRCIVVNYYIE